MVVVDTNVWISAALAKQGAPSQVVQKVLSHGQVVFSDATFQELELRLWKPKFDRYVSMELRRAILHGAKAAAQWVTPTAEITSIAYSRDADDDKFIPAALAANAPWLVSGDQDLLTLANGLMTSGSKLKILSPSQALQATNFCAY
jgi:putative PIN family toxin of toxin-antitoxin system